MNGCFRVVGDHSGKRRHLSGPSKSENSSEKWVTRPEGILTEAATPRISGVPLGEGGHPGRGEGSRESISERGGARQGGRYLSKARAKRG